MKSIEVEINGKMTPVCFADDVDKVTSEMRERHEKELKRLESYWKGVLETREKELCVEFREREEKNRRVLEHMSTPRTFQDDLCGVLRTCEREGNPAPAYDFLRGMSAGWWLCHEVNSPPHESIDADITDQIRNSLNRREEK